MIHWELTIQQAEDILRLMEDKFFGTRSSEAEEREGQEWMKLHAELDRQFWAQGPEED